MHTLSIDTMPLPPGDGEPGRAAPIDITFHGGGSRMIGLGLINGILKVLTLGLYGFWAKTEVRRRIWGALRLNGEPLSYTGTGKELFLGFLIIFGVVLLPTMLIGLAIALAFGKAAATAYQMVLYLLFFLVVGNAMYRAQRYRLSRTQWRGIRGALVGSPERYGWTYFWTLAGPIVLVALTAGVISHLTGPTVGGAIIILGLVAVLWVFPWRSNRLQAAMTADMRFGDRPLTYTGTAGPLYKRYLFAWLGNTMILLAAAAAIGGYLMDKDRYVLWFVLKDSKPSLAESAVMASIVLVALIASAVVTSWYRASQTNHFARHTHFEGATFRTEATGPSLMWLVLSNWLLSIAGLIIGAVIGGALIYASGLQAPKPRPGGPASLNELMTGIVPLLLVMPPIIIVTTMTTTFAQFRSARYFMSRLKLDGPINLADVLQSQNAIPRRGEGLAQVFDIDAF
jgi:uncharacterized membrane protein YjgN (DUF898 family)